jgi:hypothetical protein
MQNVLRLCYVSDRVAYFASAPPAEVWGDDWNDAPYGHNAGTPYEHVWRGEERVPITIELVPYVGGWLETPAERAGGNSWCTVEQINRGEIPWLTSPATEASLRAGATIDEFFAFVRAAGGRVFREVTR